MEYSTLNSHEVYLPNNQPLGVFIDPKIGAHLKQIEEL